MDGHSGPLCAVCENGYDSGSRFEECEPCFKGSASSSFYAFIFLLIFSFSMLLILYISRFHAINQKIRKLLTVWNHPSVRVKVKVFVVYCQIIAQFQSILSTGYPSNYSGFLIIMQLTNLNLSSILSLKCFNQQYTFHDEMMVATLLPIFICLLLVIGYSKSSFLSGGSNLRQKSRSSLIEWLLFVLYFFFSSAPLMK